jgi:predicted 2-oxoglutarate/Fe(II)-dependent dioxygenase YbiX
MIKTQYYIKCYENMIGKELCDEIIKTSGDFTKAKVLGDGGENVSQHRNCYDSPLNKEFEGPIYKIVGEMLQKYKEDFSYFLTGFTAEDTGYNHLLYKGSEKGEYKTHIDHFDLHPRVLSCSIILNANYDGGDFSFFEGKYLVKKKAGSVVVFPSNFCFPHAITPVTNGDRHAIITWIH